MNNPANNEKMPYLKNILATSEASPSPAAKTSLHQMLKRIVAERKNEQNDGTNQQEEKSNLAKRPGEFATEKLFRSGISKTSKTITVKTDGTVSRQ